MSCLERILPLKIINKIHRFVFYKYILLTIFKYLIHLEFILVQSPIRIQIFFIQKDSQLSQFYPPLLIWNDTLLYINT